jgi:hypothetical protein
MSQGFIKYNRGEQAENLEPKPIENHLLSVIARRVSRTGNPVKGVEIGEALIGDYEKMGLKRQKYRTALTNLIKWGYVTTRVTNRTTYARLCNSDVYDCNILDANQSVNPKITREQPDANHNQEEKKKEVKNKEEEKREKEALSQIEILENVIKNLKDQLALQTEKKKGKEKNSEKKESGQHQFTDNTPAKTYRVTPPKTKEELEAETGPKKPYEVFLTSYPFQKYGWSEKLKEIFLTYCEVKNENSHKGYSTAQMKMRITEINQGIEKHEMNWLEQLVTDAANGSNGGWASFKFDERIPERKAKKQADERKNKAAKNDKYQHHTVEESLRQALKDGYYDDSDSDQDNQWARDIASNIDEGQQQSFD